MLPMNEASPRHPCCCLHLTLQHMPTLPLLQTPGALHMGLPQLCNGDGAQSREPSVPSIVQAVMILRARVHWMAVRECRLRSLLPTEEAQDMH